MNKFISYHFNNIAIGCYEHILDIWKIKIVLSTYTDMLNIIPTVSFRFGYIKGIFYRELTLDISWLTTNLQFHIQL